MATFLGHGIHNREPLVVLQVDVFQLDFLRHDRTFPLLVFSVALMKFRHDLPGKQLQGVTDIVVAGLAGLIQQDDLIDT